MKKALFILCLFTILASSCNLPSTGSATTPTAAATPVSKPPTLAPTLTPTATSSPKEVILVTSPETDASLAGDAEKALTDLANSSGLKLTRVQSLESGAIGPGVKMVFYTSIPSNLAQVVASAPGVQFAAVSPVDITPVPNFNVIRLQPEKRTFIAGMVTILSANDWRAVGLLPVQDPPASALEDAFKNGAQYFCGVCIPYLLPVARFPLIRHTDPANYQAAVDDASKTIIYTIYVSPEISNPDMITKLAGEKYILVGGVTPPADALSHWAATVSEDVITPMRTLWPDMLNGRGGKIIKASIALSNVNPDFIGSGKKDLVNRVIDKLDNGQLDPLTPPLQ